MPQAKLEVCVDSLRSARAAVEGGADRLELCASLRSGGVTPSHGLIEACHQGMDVPLMIMIRPIEGGFCYGPDELEVMARDVRLARNSGAAGVVIGVLNESGQVAREELARLVDLARPLEVTFHRAFDLVVEPEAALEALIELGVKRVLTSGGRPTAVEGLSQLRRLTRQAAGRISIMPASGIRPDNVCRVIEMTGAIEVHASARSGGWTASSSGHPLSEQLATERGPGCSVDTVRALVRAIGPPSDEGC